MYSSLRVAARWRRSHLVRLVTCFVLGALCFLCKQTAQAENLQNSGSDANAAVLISPQPPAVVQNRFFRKALRPEISIAAGTILNEAYSNTLGGSARVGLFLSEYIGFEYGYTKFSSSDSADLEALSRLTYYKDQTSPEKTSVQPSFVRLKSLHSAHLSFSPIYGKINFLDWVIIYSDLYVSAGVGMLETSGKKEIPGILGIGQRFFFAKNFSVRVDAFDHIFNEVRYNGGKKLEGIRNAWMVSFGCSVLFFSGGEK